MRTSENEVFRQQQPPHILKDRPCHASQLIQSQVFTTRTLEKHPIGIWREVKQACAVVRRRFCRFGSFGRFGRFGGLRIARNGCRCWGIRQMRKQRVNHQMQIQPTKGQIILCEPENHRNTSRHRCLRQPSVFNKPSGIVQELKVVPKGSVCVQERIVLGDEGGA